MTSEGEYQKLLNVSFRFISYRPRSEKEIRDFLTKKINTWKIFGPGLVDKVVERLGQLGYVDDVKFAQWWVGQRQGRKPKGIPLIKGELLRHGVPRDIIEQVLSSQIEDQEVLAKKAIELKIRTVKARDKLMAFLMRRGFDSSTARRAIDATIGKR